MDYVKPPTSPADACVTRAYLVSALPGSTVMDSQWLIAVWMRFQITVRKCIYVVLLSIEVFNVNRTFIYTIRYTFVGFTGYFSDFKSIVPIIIEYHRIKG